MERERINNTVGVPAVRHNQVTRFHVVAISHSKQHLFRLVSPSVLLLSRSSQETLCHVRHKRHMSSLDRLTKFSMNCRPALLLNP